MDVRTDTSRFRDTDAAPDEALVGAGVGIAWLSGLPLDGDAAPAGPASAGCLRGGPPGPEAVPDGAHSEPESAGRPRRGWPGSVAVPDGPGSESEGAGRPRNRGPGAESDTPLSGGWPGGASGEVVTWLPDGRWVRGEPEADDPPPTDPDPRPDPRSAVRRRGRRQVALARIGARAAGWPRRAAVGLLLAVAAVLALRPADARTPAPPVAPTTDVVVAAHDLAAGTVLAPTDLRVAAMPTAVVPAGASRRAAGLIGRTAAGAIRRGETLTDARVVGPGLTAGLGKGESAAVPVRLADPDAAALIRAGDRVDVLGTPVAPDGTQATAGQTVAVASAVRVLAVLGGRDPADGVVLVVATTPTGARDLADAAARHRLTANVHAP